MRKISLIFFDIFSNEYIFAESSNLKDAVNIKK